MMVSVAPSAPTTPPDTGASTKRRPASNTRAAIVSTAPGGQVAISTTTPSSDRAASAPSANRMTSAWAAFTTMSTRTSAPALACAAADTPIPPACTRTSTAAGRMSKPRTVKPRARRFLAMGKPMEPRPMKPTVVIAISASVRGPFCNLADHRVRRDAVALVQGRECAGVEELVGQANLPEPRRHARAQQQARDGFAEAADDGVVLGHNHHASRARRLSEDRRLIQRLDGGHMQHADIDAISLERLDGFKRPHGHEAGRDDQRILAVAQELRLAEFEGVVVLVQDQGHVAAQEAHVHRAGMGGDRRHDLLDLVRVARVDDRYIRH